MPRINATAASAPREQRPVEATLERKTPHRPRDTLETPRPPVRDDSSCLSLIPRCLWATIKGLFTCIASCIASCFHCLFNSAKKAGSQDLVASALNPWFSTDAHHFTNMPIPCKLTLGMKITYSDNQILALSFPESFSEKDPAQYQQFLQIALTNAKEILTGENIQPLLVEMALLSCRNNQGFSDILLSQSIRGSDHRRVNTESTLEEEVKRNYVDYLCKSTPGLTGLRPEDVLDTGRVVVVED